MSSRRGLLLATTTGFLLAAAMLWPRPAEGEIREPASLGELARAADLIVIGRVRVAMPSLVSPAGILVLGALAGCAVCLLWRRLVRRHAAMGQGLLVLVIGLTLLGLLLVAGGPWSSKWHSRIALVEVDRRISGSSASRIPVWFRSYFACDATELEEGARYLLFLDGNGLGYRMSWYDYGAWKETAGVFQCWRGPGTRPRAEETLVEELGFLR